MSVLLQPTEQNLAKPVSSPFPLPPLWHQAPDFGRRNTLLRTLQRLWKLHPGPTCIVETGTLRDERPAACQSDGWSTLAWGWYASQTEGRAYTIDIEAEAIAICRRLTTAYADHLEYVVADSRVFFQEWNETQRGRIHLLYLDSFDYHDPERSEIHHLAEAQAALPALAPNCLILFDDTTPIGPPDAFGIPPLTGKGARAIPFLLSQGFHLEWCQDGQVLLSRETVASSCSSTGNTSRVVPECPPFPPLSDTLWSLPALNQTPAHFAHWIRSSVHSPYLHTLNLLCSAGDRACEIAPRSGYATIWLSQQKALTAEGRESNPRLVERLRQVNNLLDGRATFQCSDPFTFYQAEAPRYKVVHHQDFLHRFAAPWIQALLAQQVASAEWVVFSVPSVYAPSSHEEFGERLAPLETWQHLLSPFTVVELRYYGDPQTGGRDHLLAVVRGQTPEDALRARMHIPPEPYPFGLSAIVHTRNEARHIGACLETLRGWADEILICDMESQDETCEIALRHAAQVVTHPPLANFDRARNVSALHARYRWVFYLDADERVPAALGPRLRQLLTTEGHALEAMTFPFRHFFAGLWLQSLYPGYKAPSLYKNGRFFYHARPHEGAAVEGRIACFPANDPHLALLHYSYDSLGHYLDKMNRYTETEAANRHADGAQYHWQDAVRRFVQDFQMYYDHLGGANDGVHGFLYAFLGGFYRFAHQSKLYERRFQHQQLAPEETTAPSSVTEVLAYALQVAQSEPNPPFLSLPVEPFAPRAATVVWNGPLYSPSGYGEECRHFLLGLEEAGCAVAGLPVSWGEATIDLRNESGRRLQHLCRKSITPDFLQIIQNFPRGFDRHPQASMVIGRTMYETDRLPPEWVKGCNQMDYLWVPSEFNRETFTRSGVAPTKLRVIPGCLDPLPFQQQAPPTPLTQELKASGHFVFLSVFDWTLHKGWDVLLQAFLEAFEGREDVSLVIKLGTDHSPVSTQAAPFIQHTLGYDLLRDTRLRFLSGWMTPEELHALYQAAHAFVLPSRGEGWGRPYMEAMATGLPVIGTNWSGNTAYMTPENSYLLDYELRPVPEAGWREVPAYRGHRWAEPSREHLKHLLCRVVEERGEATAIGRCAQEYVTTQFNRQRVAMQILSEIQRLREERGRQI